jgi:uncharacterized repeat protein (TIGR01451 family)
VDANADTVYIVNGSEWDAIASDNCGEVTITYTLEGATTGSGSSTLDGVSFNEGATTVTWIAINTCSDSVTCSFIVTVNTYADVMISKTAEPNPAVAGDLLTYTIAVTNNGPGVARNTIITDTISAALVSPEYSLNGNTWEVWTGTYSLPGNLPPNNPYVIYIRGTLSAFQCAPLSNTAHVESTSRDNNLVNNHSTISTIVLDTIAPEITRCPADRELEGCSISDITGPIFSSIVAGSSYAEFSDAINQGEASDNCEIDSVSYQDVASGTCPIIVERTWTITDISDNSSTCIQIITVNDTINPTFTVPDSVTISCDEDYNNLDLTGDVTDEADNCSADLEAIYTDEIDDTDPCNIIITRSWTLEDECGNTTTQEQLIYIVDNDPPILTGTLPGGNLGNTCIDDAPSAPDTAEIAALYTDNAPAWST